MRERITKEIEVLVSPHGSRGNYYQIHWRIKKNFNLFNGWKQMVTVYSGASLSYDQPILISCFDDALKYAEKLKNNPGLIAEHYDRQDELFEEEKKRREKYYQGRNRTIKL